MEMHFSNLKKGRGKRVKTKNIQYVAGIESNGIVVEK
jgi:hypothetical protein